MVKAKSRKLHPDLSRESLRKKQLGSSERENLFGVEHRVEGPETVHQQFQAASTPLTRIS